MKLSVLDQAPVTVGNKSAAALVTAEELAVLADELGYHRMWMAEHHGTKSHVSPAPDVTAARLAAKTDNIRIGTGDVVQMHYAPLKRAEVFKALSALTPGRIDFGVGRAPGGDHFAMDELAQGRQQKMDDMYDKFEIAMQLINDEVPEGSLYGS